MIEVGAYTLRAWQGDDTAFVFEACQDPDVARWTTVPRRTGPGDAAAFVQRPRPATARGVGRLVRHDPHGHR